jgi:cell division protein FtsB
MTEESGSGRTFLRRINLLLIIFLVVACATFLYYPRYKKQHEMSEQEKSLDKEIADREKNIDELREKQKALIHDPASLEKIARDKLGYSGNNEIIYQFEDERPPDK